MLKVLPMPKNKEKEPNAEVIETLEYLLREAKVGRIQSLITFVSGTEDRIGHTFCPPSTMQDTMMTVSMLEVVKLLLTDSIYQNMQYEDFSENDPKDDKNDDDK